MRTTINLAFAGYQGERAPWLKGALSLNTTCNQDLGRMIHIIGWNFLAACQRATQSFLI
jgi:hypothetical protein